MIPATIDLYLREHHLSYEHRTHLRAVPAQKLAAAEHVSGSRIAKPVVVQLDGKLAIAVVSATQRVDLEALRRGMGAREANIVPESAFAEIFWPCEPGAEPPLGMFGLPIFADMALTREPWIVMRGGTHEDSLELSTQEWMRSENVQPIEGLGITFH